MNVPAELAGLLSGTPDVGGDEQAFPFLTTDPAGYPHVALLSRAELDVDPGRTAVLAVLAGRRTPANLLRDGRAVLVAVAGTTAHYARLSLVRAVGEGNLLGCVLEVVGHTADSVGVALAPMGFRPTAELAVSERWRDSTRLLRQLAEPN